MLVALLANIRQGPWMFLERTVVFGIFFIYQFYEIFSKRTKPVSDPIKLIHLAFEFTS